MMINKRLIGIVPDSLEHIKKTVLAQWVSLLANICMIAAVSHLLASFLDHEVKAVYDLIWFTLGISVCVICVRFVCTRVSTHESFMASKAVKGRLRQMIYQKLLDLGNAYQQDLATSEVVQVAVEGVDQLETYFGSYLPQFFYSMLAPLTLFAALSFVNLPSALVLLLCVPLIPITIAAVQTFAKKLLNKYWGQYTALGDTFLENLQGLTTLKIYQTDAMKHQQMNEESEKFRKITMRVLTMQLNSITIMDVVAYGGAAAGIIVAALQFKNGAVTLGGGIAIVLLAAEFFIPMRQLGSFFHIAMNGMAASDKIFRLLDLEVADQSDCTDFPADHTISCDNVCFSYDGEREVLHNISFTVPAKGFVAIVGESGSGKSTIASLLMGRNSATSGTITIGDTNLASINEQSLLQNITYVGFDSHLFKGSVRQNLLMACPDATDEHLMHALEQVNLAAFLSAEKGLDTQLLENGSNLSGGQRQRLSLARAILHDSPLYIFDEATSNVDVESENDIMREIHELARRKTVILITHRLANAEHANNILVMDKGMMRESGTHTELLGQDGLYTQLWSAQSDLEHFRKADDHE